MKIKNFRIENFRNIKLAECRNPPDFMVICGGNGCGKSALLQALMTAKEHAGSYGNFDFDSKCVSADAQKAIISMCLEFTDIERQFVRERHWGGECPQEDSIIVEIEKNGSGKVIKRSSPTHNLLGWYSRKDFNAPGFFDYFEAHRNPAKNTLSNWDASFLSDNNAKSTLSTSGRNKFQFTKQYLAGLKMRDLQNIQTSQMEGKLLLKDSLKDIREFFNCFFSPMKFIDVRINTSPFQFIIRTPRGDIDIDDLSSGEKEILNTFIRFHQLQYKDAVILFDEADAHLHPDLERRYLEVLRKIGKGNQLWITTHSPEMMMAAGSESLYTILKEPITPDGNQFVRVTDNDQLHSALSEVMGSRGLVSFNQRIIFIEGEESSIDRELYENFYPPGVHNVSFVPAGNSATVRKTAERVNELLTSSITFQQYYAIIDGDIERSIDPPLTGRLYKLPVYHVENFLLDSRVILEVCKEMLRANCPYAVHDDVTRMLKTIILEDNHLNAFTNALREAKWATLAKQVCEGLYNGNSYQMPKLEFCTVKSEAKQLLEKSISTDEWRSKCKGREVLKAFCSKHQVKYEIFRNLILSKMASPPEGLSTIMDRILNSHRSDNGPQENKPKID